jgi:transcriptional regulator with XRE-family HTH domain
MAQQTHPGLAIRAARRAAGLTVVELAARTGVSRATLTRWEAGRVAVHGGGGLRAVVAVIRSANAEQGRVLGQALGLVPRAARTVDPAAAPSVLEFALYRVADAIDVPAGRLRWAIEEMARATREAGGTLDDLERSCRDGAAKVKARPPPSAG